VRKVSQLCWVAGEKALAYLSRGSVSTAGSELGGRRRKEKNAVPMWRLISPGAR